MYTYEEVRRALLATIEMVKGDFSGEEYLDSLSKAAGHLQDPEVDRSFDLFTRVFEDQELVESFTSIEESL